MPATWSFRASAALIVAADLCLAGQPPAADEAKASAPAPEAARRGAP